ncbi:MAG: phosphoenolpyruvate--protein phosphotransferase [Spiroplasma sp.]|nr:phosphoenolpyruvate--protein phosphotransferase [Mycoplasmatales bacterium]
MMEIIKGIAASKGIVIAKAYKLEELNIDIETSKFVTKEAEIVKFERTLVDTISQLDEIYKVAVEKLGEEEAAVFEAHKTIVLDPELKTQVLDKINNTTTAAKALDEVTTIFAEMFESMDDEYFQARAADVKDVKKRLLANALDLKIPSLSTIKEEVIIIAEDLTPSETSQLDAKYTKGFITSIGGRTSHAAIMARSMEIPAIVGTTSILAKAKDGDILILNALDGTVTINPTEDKIEEAKKELAKYEEEIEGMKKYKNSPTISCDKYQVELAANIGTPNDLEGVLKNGAEGIGLYRTEFLYMDAKELPSEEIQFQAYKKVIETMEGKPVVVRTLDIGGDKELPYMDFPEEMNPFLGYRAIRMCLDRDDIFRVQVRALLRASAFGNLKIMFPMIATLEEFREAKAIIFEEKELLVKKNINISDNIEIGIMVEIPSTAVMADTFAKEVDFFSIGTNDLIQYTMACDRMSEKVSYLYQPYNPAILRLIKNVIDAAKKENIWAGMCGEMASDPIAIIILLGLGLHEFSMSPSAILPSRMQISKLSKTEIEKHVEAILNLSTAKEVEKYVIENLKT